MLVSVIIPCYNVADYIRECVESVFNQTYNELEVICVDNNSTDKTPLVLQELKDKFLSLKVVNELKKGACAARNKGLSVANGEWIQFLDGDDLLLPEKVKHQVCLVQKNPELSFIAGSYIRKFADGKQSCYILKPDNHFLALANNKLGNTCSNFFKKMDLVKVGGWNEELKSSQEANLMFSLLLSGGEAIYDDAPLTIIQERAGGSISQTNLAENLERFIKLRIGILRHFENQPGNDHYSRKIRQLLFDKIRELYLYDPKKSLELYEKLIPGDFKPTVTAATTNHYLIIYKLFGFKLAQKIKGLLN